MKNRKTSKENSVEVSVKKPVESTEKSRLIELYRTKREKGKDSQNRMLITCNERKQPKKVTVKSEYKKHSKNRISKAKGTLHKAHKHPQNSLQTHNKDQYNSMKRSKSGKKEMKVPHTQVK